MRNASSSSVEPIGMSLSNRAFACTSTDVRSGWGGLAAAADAEVALHALHGRIADVGQRGAVDRREVGGDRAGHEDADRGRQDAEDRDDDDEDDHDR